VVDCDVESIEHKFYEDKSLNIFEMIANTSELVTKLVNRKLLSLRRFQVDPKEIKCSMQWW